MGYSPIRAQRGRVQASGWVVWPLRIVATLHVLSLLAQGVLAGLFVTGDVGMLELHEVNGHLASAWLFLQLVYVVLLWRPGRGPSWPIWATVMLTGIEQGQIGLGYAGDIGYHIPVAMLLIALSAMMAAWTWTGLTRRDRVDGPEAVI